MLRSLLLLTILLWQTAIVVAQPVSGAKNQQELEKERQQLKRELEEVQLRLNSNKKDTRENLSTLIAINRKLNIQENLVDNISKEINIMDDNIYKSQRDVNKLRLLLDTLKQEYAKSMVYAYRNRSNSDFLNFIFSSSSFNDAIKRINYLKSYRNYREMQGENILRTQALLKTRIDELSNNKLKKNEVLDVKSKEMTVLQQQQDEKNRIVQKLKAQGKELNNQIAAKKKQMQKVNNAIQAAIRIELAKAEKARKEKEAALRAKPKTADPVVSTTPGSKPTTPKNGTKSVSPAPEPRGVLLADENDFRLNASFEKNRGNLPWPINSGYLLLHYGTNKLENGIIVNSNGISIGCDVGTPVRAIFDGEVLLVNNYDDMYLVVIKHGNYFTGYSNIGGVNLSKGQEVKAGQVIGRSAANMDGVGAVDLLISREKNELNPESWLKPRAR
ncbi:MAG: hypothetical protein RLY16_760 [Bacteroidota bacterium]